MSQIILLKIPGSYFQVNSNYEFSYFRISLGWTNKTIFKTVQILILRCSINIFINFLPLGQWFSNQDIHWAGGNGECRESLMSKWERGSFQHVVCSEAEVGVLSSCSGKVAPSYVVYPAQTLLLPRLRSPEQMNIRRHLISLCPNICLLSSGFLTWSLVLCTMSLSAGTLVFFTGLLRMYPLYPPISLTLWTNSDFLLEILDHAKNSENQLILRTHL